jgi:sphingomyelin phosphodiesterase 2
MTRAEARALVAALLVLLTAPPSGAAERLRVLSINVAALPLIHPKLSERMRELGLSFGEGRYDLIAVQEAWLDADSRFLADAADLPYYVRFPRRVAVGTGLSLLSRWPLAAPRQKVFTSRPSALRVYHGEWPANKGVLSATLQTPSGPLDVYDTHLVSRYPSALYRTLRVIQAFDAAEEVLRRSAGRPYLLLGDLNAGPGEPEYELLRDLLGAEDPCVSGGRDACGPTIDEGRRVDHVLVPAGGARLAKARVVLSEKRAGLSLSDHAGVEAEVDLRLLALKPKPDPARRRAALRRVIAAVEAMSARMQERLRRRAWIPLYGLALSIRYARQLDQLVDVRARAETALIAEKLL